jgi:hypothetical protein
MQAGLVIIILNSHNCRRTCYILDEALAICIQAVAKKKPNKQNDNAYDTYYSSRLDSALCRLPCPMLDLKCHFCNIIYIVFQILTVHNASGLSVNLTAKQEEKGNKMGISLDNNDKMTGGKPALLIFNMFKKGK